MRKNVAFFVRTFSERGTEVSTLNYAIDNQEILGNKSIIIFFNKDVTDGKEPKVITSQKVFEKQFKVFHLKFIEEIKNIIDNEQITHAYIQSHGFYRDDYKFEKKEIWGTCKTIYHYIFGPMARQGSDIRCVIGMELNHKYNKKLKVLPYIVNKHTYHGDLRNKLQIDKNCLVIGRHGGVDTFDIDFVKKTIIKTLKERNDIIFLFLNTAEFFKHNRIIYLNKTISSKDKSIFIDTCDAMLHGRKHGETFGLAVAEFSAANKPIISYAKSKDKEHLRILKNKAFIYKNEKDLLRILTSLKKEFILKNDWNCYKSFEPEKVMKKFNEICLTKKTKKSFNFDEYIRDLPWEIFIFFSKIYNFFKMIFFKSIPLKYKKKLKFFLKSIRS